MKITIEIPEYVVMTLRKDAERRGKRLARELRGEMIKQAEGVISTWFAHILSRKCSHCGNFEFAPSGATAANRAPKECGRCGKRLTAKDDRCGVVNPLGVELKGEDKARWYASRERLLRRIEAVRRSEGFAARRPAEPLKELAALEQIFRECRERRQRRATA